MSLTAWEPLSLRELDYNYDPELPKAVLDFETNRGAVNGNLTDVFCLVLYLVEHDDSFVYHSDDFLDTQVLTEIQSILGKHTWVIHNAAFDLWVAAQLGLKIDSYECTYVMSYCINPSMPHSLGAIAKLIGTPHQKQEFDDFTQLSEEMVDYCIADCKTTWDVYQDFISSPEFADAKEIYEIEKQFILPLMEINHTGVYVDRENWEKIVSTVSEERQRILDKILEIAPLAPGKSYRTKRLRDETTICDDTNIKEGLFYFWERKEDEEGNLTYIYKKIERFNPGSGSQIAWVLKYLYGWEPEVFTDSGKPSTDQDVLNELPYELASLLVEYAKLNKVVTTYGETMLENVRDDGRLYGSFNQCVTKTGRLSSSSPNLQNIPAKGELGDAIRKLFIASPDHNLVGCDVDSFQVRILAWYLNTFLSEEYDDAIALFKEFCENPEADPHQVNADIIGCERKIAKNCLFGDIFGFGAEKFASMSNLDIYRAREILTQQRERYPSIAKLKELVWSAGERNGGVVHDLYGRRGVYPDLNSKVKGKKARAQRQSFNFIIQSTEASIIKNWLICIRNALKYCGRDDVKLLLQVHDEILLECPKDSNIEQVKQIVQGCLQDMNWLGDTLPVTGTPEVGDSWYGVH